MTDQRLPFQQPEGDPRPARAHPGTPRDVDLDEWLRAAGFHPADTLMKQMGHEATRNLVGLLGKHLHRLVPASREKSIIFAHLEQVRHYANQALAVHGGPPPHVDATHLAELLEDTKRIGAQIGARLPEDPRIEQYKAEQRGEEKLHGPYGASKSVADWDSVAMAELPPEIAVYMPGAVADQMPARRVPLADAIPDDPAEASAWLEAVNEAVNAKHPGAGWSVVTRIEVAADAPVVEEQPFTNFRYSTGQEPAMRRTLDVQYQEHAYAPQVAVEVSEHDEGENRSEVTTLYVDDADVLEEFAAGFLAAANRLRRDLA